MKKLSSILLTSAIGIGIVGIWGSNNALASVDNNALNNNIIVLDGYNNNSKGIHLDNFYSDMKISNPSAYTFNEKTKDLTVIKAEDCIITYRQEDGKKITKFLNADREGFVNDNGFGNPEVKRADIIAPMEIDDYSSNIGRFDGGHDRDFFVFTAKSKDYKINTTFSPISYGMIINWNLYEVDKVDGGYSINTQLNNGTLQNELDFDTPTLEVGKTYIVEISNPLMGYDTGYYNLDIAPRNL